MAHYDLTVAANGFTSQRRTNLDVDTDAAVRVDTTLAMGDRSDTVTVTTETGVPGRDLVDPSRRGCLRRSDGGSAAERSELYRSAVDSTRCLSCVDAASECRHHGRRDWWDLAFRRRESGERISINGQRESSNGFMVNGVDVQEHMNGGTSVVPDLDSIEQFRVLTNNFDPEYGNYNGGMVTVVTKSGSNRLHGKAFEFFRNTSLDARGYFDLTRPEFKQNQFGMALGGPIGGPLERLNLFFFIDYQGTRKNQGISTGNISVPTLAERSGNFAGELTKTVSGPYSSIASLAEARLCNHLRRGLQQCLLRTE